MKKFGGSLSTTFVLDTFRIDIVESVARNPLLPAGPTHMPSSGSTQQQQQPLNSSAAPPFVRIKRPPGGAATGETAFRCNNFVVRLALSDVVDLTSVDTSALNPVDFNIRGTTTRMYCTVTVDALEQYVRTPLLRLVHQFVTMVYHIHDQREEMETRHSGGGGGGHAGVGGVSSGSGSGGGGYGAKKASYQRHKKQDSKVGLALREGLVFLRCFFTMHTI